MRNSVSLYGDSTTNRLRGKKIPAQLSFGPQMPYFLIVYSYFVFIFIKYTILIINYSAVSVSQVR